MVSFGFLGCPAGGGVKIYFDSGIFNIQCRESQVPAPPPGSTAVKRRRVDRVVQTLLR